MRILHDENPSARPHVLPSALPIYIDSWPVSQLGVRLRRLIAISQRPSGYAALTWPWRLGCPVIWVGRTVAPTVVRVGMTLS